MSGSSAASIGFNIRVWVRLGLMPNISLRRRAPHLLLAVIYWLAIFPIFADPYINHTFNFKHLLTLEKDFVGPGRITSIAQDKKGFIWLGGEAGLARYDGSRIRMFYHQAKDRHSLSSNFIRAIEVDAHGVMWVVTAATHGGLLRYDERHENFIRYEVNQSSPVSIDAIDSDSAGNIFLVTNNGYLVLPLGEAHFKTLIVPSSDSNDSIELKGNSLFVDRADRIWISSHDSGLLLFDTKNNTTRTWRLDGGDGTLASDIKNVFQDRHGQIWISTNGSGVSRLSADLGTLKTFRYQPDNPRSIGSDMTSSMVEDKNGKIWIVTVNSGVSIFDPQAETFTRHISRGDDPASIKTNATQLLFRDRADDLWLVQYPLGVDYLNMDGYEVTRKLNNPEDSSSISNSGILAIKSDYKGEIWIGTEEGLNRLDKKTGLFKRYLKESSQSNSGLKSNTILSLEEDLDRTFWVGTYGGGLHKFDPANETFTHLPSSSGPGGYVGNIIWALLRDSTNIIWVAGSEGLARYNREKNSFTYFPELSVGTPFKDKTILIEIRPGKLLVGSFWGLHLLDVQTGEFARVGENSALFVDQNINSLATIDNGDAWIATENGIVFMSPDGQITGRLGIEQGLPAKPVGTVKQLSDGKVWANTGNGVAIIDPKTKKIVTLHKSQGLACDGYKHGVLIHEDNNLIYLGGTDGLSILPRQQFENLPRPVAVSIIGLSILNFNMLPELEGSPLTQPISETANIELSHQQNMFAIEFSALDFKLSDRLVYEYKLEGFSSAWTQPGEQLVAAFTNLNPGSYRFLVRAYERGASPSEHYTALNIKVRPAPWLSLVAIIGYVLFILMSFYGLYAIKDLRQKKMAAEKSADTKSEFFATISHEIRTPLAGVIGMLNFAIKDRTITAKSAERLKIAKANADVLLEITSDVLDLNKIEAGKLCAEKVGFDLGAVVKQELESAAFAAQRKKLSLLLVLPKNIPPCIGDPTRLAQVLRKLLNNAIKFTDNGGVSVEVELLKDRLRQDDWISLRCTVRDTGAGISPDNIRNLFSKFSQAEVTSARSYCGGTGLGLAICKKLLMLMDGEISATSELGKGSSFQFSLPILSEPALGISTDLGIQKEMIEIVKSAQPRKADPIISNAPTDTLHQKLLVAFRSSLPARILEINGACNEKDYETLGRVFHGIKGGAAHLGDDSLANICAALERFSDAGDMTAVEQGYPKFLLAAAPYLTSGLS